MEKEKIDLHMHSHYSDGLSTVEEIFKIAKKAGFSLIAITDHDTSEHWDDAMHYSQQTGIRCLVGTEFSSMYQGREIHILGYGYDDKHEHIASILKDYKEANIRWMMNLAVNFASKTGVAPDMSDFDFKGSPDKVRMTKYMLDKGYINLFYLEEKEVFSTLVANTFKQGGVYHVKRKIKRRRYDEIIRSIHEAGGIAVIAHPQKNKLEKEDILALKEAGLDGVEVYTRKTLQDSEKYIAIAKEYDLCMTGGSDFHGNTSIGIEYEESILEKFIEKMFVEQK